MNNYGNLGLNNRILNAYKKKLGTKPLTFSTKDVYEKLIDEADNIMIESKWDETFNNGSVAEIIDQVLLHYYCETGKGISNEEALNLIINPKSKYYYENKYIDNDPTNGKNVFHYDPYNAYSGIWGLEHEWGWGLIEKYIKAKEKREEAKKLLEVYDGL